MVREMEGREAVLERWWVSFDMIGKGRREEKGREGRKEK